jgi:hypothetical protein
MRAKGDESESIIMLRFWDTFIRPALALQRPKNIVEIGVEKGNITRLVLDFVERTGATLHSIDPRPQISVEDWKHRYPEHHFVLHEVTSAEALPAINRFDAVLIDGDHNWFTVMSELRLLDKLSAERGHMFPLVFLHDIGWPYGRRDLYYNPDAIPPEKRHAFACKGMWPGFFSLLERGGFNAHLCNAVLENTPKNGVLTAIEDFRNENPRPTRFLKIPGFFGLGILFPADLGQDQPELVGFLNSLALPGPVQRHLELLEAERIDLLLR